MDLQAILDQAVTANREQRMKNSDQLSLGELILKLEPLVKAHESDKEQPIVKYDFEYLFPTAFDSWRGSYAELSLNFCSSENNKPLSLTEFYNLCKETVGKEFTGYKGGEFTMGKNTPIWIANYGNSGETALIDVVDNGYAIILVTAHREF